MSRYQAEAALESISRRSSRYIASEQARQIRQPSLSPSSVVRQRAHLKSGSIRAVVGCLKFRPVTTLNHLVSEIRR